MGIEVKIFLMKFIQKKLSNMYNGVGAILLVLSKNDIEIKYAHKGIKIHGGYCIHGKLVFVKYCPQVKFNT